MSYKNSARDTVTLGIKIIIIKDLHQKLDAYLCKKQNTLIFKHRCPCANLPNDKQGYINKIEQYGPEQLEHWQKKTAICSGFIVEN